MNAPAPVVTVAICLHNGSAFIVETLHTVFAQSFEDFEVLVIDDGSTDGGGNLVETTFTDARLRLIRQPNAGLGAARQRSLDLARGEFVAFLDQDDLWHPDKLARQVEAARARPAAALIAADCFFVDPQGVVLRRSSDGWPRIDPDAGAEDGYRLLMVHGCFITLSMAMVRADMARACGGFRRDFQYVEDYDLWLRLARCHPLMLLRDPLGSWRIHDQQFTRRHPEVALREHIELIDPLLADATLPADIHIALGDFLFGQHRDTFRSLWRQGRAGLALGVLANMRRYPDCLVRDLGGRVMTTPVGALVRGVRGIRHTRTRLFTSAKYHWQRTRLRLRRAPGKLRRWWDG